MVYYFWGEDTFGARQAIGELALTQKCSVQWLDKTQLEEKSLRQRLEESGGLFGKSLLVVRDPSQLPAHLQKMLVEVAEEQLAGEAVVMGPGEAGSAIGIF
jgi:DNA polymerase III delta subunit